MPKFRTLILFSSSEIGGAEKSLSRLANKGEKNEFILGSLSGDGILLQSKMNTNLEVNKFGFKKISFFNLALSCIKALIFSKKNNIDFLYICGFKACTIIRIISIFIKTPKIIHAIRWNPKSTNKDDTIFRKLEKIFIFKTSGWICNSRSAKDTLVSCCGIPPEKIITIYNGIDISEKIINNNSNVKKVVLTLSNFAPRKGIIEYLSIIEKVITLNKKVTFILAGRDDMNGIVHKKIKEKKLDKFIKTPGFVYDANEVLKKADLVVLPSLLPEGCPTSILEAMSFGKPVIGYDINGLNELVINNKTGFLIPLNDQASMTSCIIELLSSSELIEKFGINGYNTVKNNFSLNEMLRKHRNYLANL